MWSLKYDTNKVSMKQKQTDMENTLVVAKARAGEVWTGSLGVADLLYTEWINNNVLVYPGHYIQYPEINHNGKEYKIE